MATNYICHACPLRLSLTRSMDNRTTFCGQVAERLNALVLKTSVRASVPWVRIPPCPPEYFLIIFYICPVLAVVLRSQQTTASRITCKRKPIFLPLGLFCLRHDAHKSLQSPPRSFALLHQHMFLHLILAHRS